MQVSSIIKRSKAWIQTKVCSRNHGGTLSAGSVMACSYPKLCLISFLKHTKFTYLDGVLPTVGISLLHHLKFKTIPQCHTHKPIWLKLSYILASFNMTVHGIKCTISKQKSDKFLVNATICAKFWRGEGINMTLEKITADVHLFSPFLLWSHLKLVLLFFFHHLWLGAYGSYMAVLLICCCPSHIRVRMEEKWRQYHLRTHLCGSAGKCCAAGIEKDP